MEKKINKDEPKKLKTMTVEQLKEANKNFPELKKISKSLEKQLEKDYKDMNG